MEKFIGKPKIDEKLQTLTYLRKMFYLLVLNFVLKSHAMWVLPLDPHILGLLNNGE